MLEHKLYAPVLTFPDPRLALERIAEIARAPDAWGCALSDLAWAIPAPNRPSEQHTGMYLILPKTSDVAVDQTRKSQQWIYPPSHAAPPGTTEVPFIPGLGMLLGGIDSVAKVDAANIDDWLIICPRDADPTALYSRLRGGGQRVRCAVGRSETEWHTLFWVRQNDRMSSRLAPNEAGELFGAVCLAGMKAGRDMIFLPLTHYSREMQPGLDALAEAAAATPGLFGARKGGAETVRPLFAAWPRAEANLAHSMLLGHLTFVADTPRPWLTVQPSATIVVEDNVERAQELNTKLEALKNSPGYSLRVIDFPLSDSTKDYHQDLTARRAWLETELEALSLESPANPVLYRFAFEQAAEIATLLHAFRPMERTCGAVKYAFARRADAPESAGHHYLLALDTTSIHDLKTTVEMGRCDPPPDRFQVDPLWLERYRQPNPNQDYWVMVPHGMALYPSLHGWDAAQLKQELAQAANNEGPATPFYLFEPASGAHHVQLSVLDYGKFEDFPRAFRLFNDTMRVVGHLGMDETLRAMADVDFANGKLAGMRDQLAALEANLAQKHEELERDFFAASRKLHVDLRYQLETNVQSLTALHEQYRYVAEILGRFNAEYEKHRKATTKHLRDLEKTLVPGGTKQEHCVALLAQANHLLVRALTLSSGATHEGIEPLARELSARINADDKKIDPYTRDGLPEHLARPLREADLAMLKADGYRATLRDGVTKRLQKLVDQKNALLKYLWDAILFWRPRR